MKHAFKDDLDKIHNFSSIKDEYLKLKINLENLENVNNYNDKNNDNNDNNDNNTIFTEITKFTQNIWHKINTLEQKITKIIHNLLNKNITIEESLLKISRNVSKIEIDFFNTSLISKFPNIVTELLQQLYNNLIYNFNKKYNFSLVSNTDFHIIEFNYSEGERSFEERLDNFDNTLEIINLIINDLSGWFGTKVINNDMLYNK